MLEAITAIADARKCEEKAAGWKPAVQKNSARQDGSDEPPTSADPTRGRCEWGPDVKEEDEEK